MLHCRLQCLDSDAVSSLVGSLPNLRVLRMLGTKLFDREWPMDALSRGHAASLTTLEVYAMPFGELNYADHDQPPQPHLISERVKKLTLLSAYTRIYASDLPRLRMAFPSLEHIVANRTVAEDSNALQLQPHDASMWLPLLQQLQHIDFKARIMLGDGWPALAANVSPLQCLQRVAWEAQTPADWNPHVLAIAPSAIYVELSIGACSPEQWVDIVRDVVACHPRMHVLRLLSSAPTQPWAGLEAVLLVAQHLYQVVLQNADHNPRMSSKPLCAANGHTFHLMYPV